MVETPGVGQGAFKTFFVDDDANDLWERGSVGKGIEQATHHFFAVGHLLDVFGRDEADGVDVLKSRGYKLTQVVHFRFRGDYFWEALPGVARAFDELYVSVI